MPTWPSQGGPNKGSSRAKTTSSTACIREPQHSSSGCKQHLPPAAGPGKMGSTQHRSANRGKQQTEVQFAHRHLSPTPQFSPSLPLPVWEVTARFFPEEPSSSIHLSLQKLQLPPQTPTPGYKKKITVLSELSSGAEKKVNLKKQQVLSQLWLFPVPLISSVFGSSHT